jgi:hypothetical protein
MTKFPSDKVCELIAKLWVAGMRAANISEGQNALAALKRLQADHGLSDVMVAYIAESHSKPADAANVLDLVLEVITSSKIVMTFEQQVTVTFWILHTHVFDQFFHTPRLLLQSYEPGCGKTSLAILVRALAYNPLFTSSTRRRRFITGYTRARTRRSSSTRSSTPRSGITAGFCWPCSTPAIAPVGALRAL